MGKREDAERDLRDWPHVYTGPTTRWGLAEGSICKIVGSRAGGKTIRRKDGKHFTVGAGQVSKRPRAGVGSPHD